MQERVFWGLAMVAAGVVFLLGNLGFFGVTLWGLWPLVVMVVAIRGLVWHAQRRFDSWVSMAVLLLLLTWSAIALGNNLQLTDLRSSDVWRQGWPLILVAAGASMLFRKSGRHFFRVTRDHGEGRLAKGGTGIVGDMRYGSRPWVFEDLDLSLAAGDVVVDLTTATISPGEHQLSVNLGAGEVDVLVPADVTIEVDAQSGVGEVTVVGERRSGLRPGVNLVDPAPQPGAEEKRVQMHLQVGAGEIKVQRPRGFGWHSAAARQAMSPTPPTPTAPSAPPENEL